jgi:hypothetical protein
MGKYLHGVNLTFRSKLYLVDLAGSERLKNTQVVGTTLTETIHINKSLTVLGLVINALVKKQQHIPYRDSLLTFLLRDALGLSNFALFPQSFIVPILQHFTKISLIGGDSKTVMIVQVSPTLSDKSETLCSLRFASRVKHVELGILLRSCEFYFSRHLISLTLYCLSGQATKHFDTNDILAMKEEVLFVS